MRRVREPERKAWPTTVELVVCALTWTVLAFIRSLTGIAIYEGDGHVIQALWSWRIQVAALDYGVWLLLTPFIIYTARRFPIRALTFHTAFLVHGGISLIVTVVYVLLRSSVNVPIDGRLLFVNFSAVMQNPLTSVAIQLPRSIPVYSVVTGIVILLDLHHRLLREQGEHAAAALQTRELESQLAQARLSMLKMQLQPHFLFNTLNGISALIDWKPAEARRMLTGLSDLLRSTLDMQDRQLIPLSQELDWIEDYLDLQRTRYGDRLRIQIHASAGSLPAGVPPMILQPLVENAFKHGIEPNPDAGFLSIRAVSEHGRLRVTVRDDGMGVSPAAPTGVGISNTRQRLGTMYANDWSMTVGDAPTRGAQVVLDLPLTCVPS